MIDESRILLDALKARFPYMFAGENLGFDFYRGWLLDFVLACEQIDALLGDDKRGFHFRQIKEKYGWPRYYFKTDDAHPRRLSITTSKGLHEKNIGFDGHDLEQKISMILLHAEQAGMHKCAACGAPAEVRQVHSMFLCVCDEHAYEDERGAAVANAIVKDTNG